MVRRTSSDVFYKKKPKALLLLNPDEDSTKLPQFRQPIVGMTLIVEVR